MESTTKYEGLTPIDDSMRWQNLDDVEFDLPDDYQPESATQAKGSFDDIQDKASSTSRISSVGSFFKGLGKGVARLFGGVIAAVGSSAAGLIQAAWAAPTAIAVVAGAIPGGAIGLGIGLLVGKPLEGMAIGAGAGAVIVGGAVGITLGIALSVPYSLAHGVTHIGTSIMKAGDASPQAIKFFERVSGTVVDVGTEAISRAKLGARGKEWMDRQDSLPSSYQRRDWTTMR